MPYLDIAKRREWDREHPRVRKFRLRDAMRHDTDMLERIQKVAKDKNWSVAETIRTLIEWGLEAEEGDIE